MTTRDITIEDARTILTIIDVGLVRGLGIAEPGKFCVEADLCRLRFKIRSGITVQGQTIKAEEEQR